MRPAIALLAILLLAAPARAADWGGIVPGASTVDNVRARYGEPQRVATQKVEGYDSVQWTYEGAGAPAGMHRLVVDFGYLAPTGYRPDVVRVFRLEPRPYIFTRNLVLDGWGPPTGASAAGAPPSFFYASGLVVYFDDDQNAISMVFTPPQPSPKDSGAKQP
jgi:hypothetical protein